MAALLDSLPELVMYVPVPRHRRDWNGSEDILIGTLLANNSAVAFSTMGESIILSNKRPPPTPVLALVSSERPGPSLASNSTAVHSTLSSSDIAASSSAPDGIYLTESYIVDLAQYEHWMLGDPEVEIHVFLGEDLTWSSCIGENNSDFDQNYNSWSGFVRVASLPNASAGSPSEIPIHLQVWECDYNCCDFVDGNYVGKPRPNVEISDYLLAGFVVGGMIWAAIKDDWAVALMFGYFSVQMPSYLNADEYIGHLEPARSDCWKSASGPEHWRIIGPESTAGGVHLDFVGLERSGIICPSASIAGPEIVEDWTTTYQWDATNPSGGDGSYVYEWSRHFDKPGASWEVVGSGPTLSMTVPDGESATFTLALLITSAGVSTQISLWVFNNNQSDPECPDSDPNCIEW